MGIRGLECCNFNVFYAFRPPFIVVWSMTLKSKGKVTKRSSSAKTQSCQFLQSKPKDENPMSIWLTVAQIIKNKWVHTLNAYTVSRGTLMTIRPNVGQYVVLAVCKSCSNMILNIWILFMLENLYIMVDTNGTGIFNDDVTICCLIWVSTFMLWGCRND